MAKKKPTSLKVTNVVEKKTKVRLNPQPEPPKPPFDQLNPQPEPPKPGPKMTDIARKQTKKKSQ